MAMKWPWKFHDGDIVKTNYKGEQECRVGIFRDIIGRRRERNESDACAKSMYRG